MMLWQTKIDALYKRNPKRPLVIAHRGDARNYPENSIEGVISVRYLNDNHEADIRDDGNELEELQKRFDERTRWSNKLRKCYIDLEEEIAELKSKVKDNVFIVVEDCDNDETRNVACFSTKSAAQKYCDHYNENLSKPRFCFEEWKIGESYNYNTQEK